MPEAAVLDDELRAMFAGERLDDPFPILNRVREQAPVYPLGTMTLVTRHTDVRAALADEEQLSAELYTRGSRAAEIVATFSPEGQRMWHELAEYDRRFVTRL
jgi:cytochrome P450